MGKHLLTYETNKEYDNAEVMTTLAGVDFSGHYSGYFSDSVVDELTEDEDDKSYTCNIDFLSGPAGSSHLTSVKLKSASGFFARMCDSAKTRYTYEGEIFLGDKVRVDVYENGSYSNTEYFYPVTDKNEQLIGYARVYNMDNWNFEIYLYTGTTSQACYYEYFWGCLYTVKKPTKYLEGTVNSVMPGVSYTLQNEQVCYNPIVRYITVTYNVISTEEETFLYNPNGLSESGGDDPGAGAGLFGSSRGIEDTASTDEVVLMPTENTLLGLPAIGDSGSKSDYSSKFKVVSMEIDGVKANEIVSSYTFNSIGIHVVKFGVATYINVVPDGLFLSGSVTCYGSGCYVDSNNTDIIRIEIPEGYKSIGKNCFAGAPLSSGISLPSTIKKIDDNAFYNVYDLPGITFPSGLKSLGEHVFSNASIASSFVLPESLKQIGIGCFAYAHLVDIPYFPSKITKVPAGCFNGTQFQNTVFDSGEFGRNVSVIQEDAFRESNLTSVVIPSNIRVINNAAFYSAASLTSITLSEGVERIGTSFCYDTAITDIAFPNSLKVLGADIYDIYAPYYYGRQAVPGACTSVTFGNNLEALGADAFSATSVASLVLPSSLKRMGEDCFSYAAISSVTLSTGLTEIPNGCFSCTKLQEIIIPEGVTVIGNNAFNSVPLTSVILPSTLKTIGDYSFSYCSGLTTLIIPEGTIAIGDSAFRSCSNLASITFANTIKIIADSAFVLCSKLTAVTLPQNLVQLGTLNNESANYYDYGVFGKCTGLTTVNIPSGVSVIGANCFSGCTSLATINFDDANLITRIGNKAFYGTPFLSNVQSVGGIKYPTPKVAYSVGSNSLTSYAVRSGTVSITYGCFSGCRNATAITIPNTVEILGGGCFNNTLSLTGITIPGSLKEIGSGGYDFYISGLRNLVVEEGAKIVPSIYSAINLTSVTIPSTITSIDQIGGFSQCPSLTGANGNCPLISSDHKYLYEGSTLLSFMACADTVFTVPNNIEWFSGNNAFSNKATNLVSLTIHSNFKGIKGCSDPGCYNSCFGYLPSLSSITFYTNQIPAGFMGSSSAYNAVKSNGVVRCPAGTSSNFAIFVQGDGWSNYGIPSSKNWTVQEMS